MIHLYKLDKSDKKKFREDLLRISAKWSPEPMPVCIYGAGKIMLR